MRMPMHTAIEPVPGRRKPRMSHAELLCPPMTKSGQ
jgi:hypothetical protein